MEIENTVIYSALGAAWTAMMAGFAALWRKNDALQKMQIDDLKNTAAQYQQTVMNNTLALQSVDKQLDSVVDEVKNLSRQKSGGSS